jgi:energy-coupling factor transporter ATP-binding protein EcfA2
MGVVYKARQAGLNRVVALKVIPPTHLVVPGRRELFAREVRAAGRLDHPNIVTVYQTDLDGPLPYLAMEYVPGTDLRRLVADRGPVPVADAVEYARQAAEGLQHAHEQGLVHRDVKPSNLMVTPAPGTPGDARPPRVKVLDVGLALVAADLSGEDGGFLGTPDYVAPEQAGDGRRASARSDLYSLGATLYYLLTGENPFPNRTLGQKLRGQAADKPPPPSRRRPEVPPDLDAVVQLLLAPDPAGRFRTAREVAAALARVRAPGSGSRAGRGPTPRHADTTRPHGMTMSENFFDRGRAAVARLNEAVTARVAAEADLSGVYAAAAGAADREVARVRKANAAARAADLRQADEARAAEAAATAARYDEEEAAADRARDDRRRVTSEKFKAASDRGRAEYNDRVWHTDSMLEAGEKSAREQQEALKRKAAGGAERVEELWAEAAPVLAGGRVARADIEAADDPAPPDDDDPISRLNKALEAAEADLAAATRLRSPRLASPSGLGLFVGAAALLGASSAAVLDPSAAAGVAAASALLLGGGGWVAVRGHAHQATLRAGKVLGRSLAAAARAARLLDEYADAEYAAEHARLAEYHARKRKEADDHYLPLFDRRRAQYDAEVARAEAEHAAQTEKVRRRRAAETRAEEEVYRDRRAAIVARYDAELKAAEDAAAARVAAAAAVRDEGWDRLAADWADAAGGVAGTFAALRAEGADLFPPWDAVARGSRPLPDAVPAGVRFGEWRADLRALPDGMPADPRLAPPANLDGPVPAFLPFPDRCSVLLRARDDGRAVAVNALQAMMLRFLTGLPPGKVRFTIVDPVGLGDNFAAFMHLADYDEKLVTSRIWTEPAQVEQRLTDLTDHIASVIQKYLRNQYRTIEDYNRAAGEVAEPYRVLVVANFPAGFTPDAAKRLVSVAQSGPSCGVCTLVSMDTRATMPRDFSPADLDAASFTLTWKDGAFVPKDPVLAAFPLALDRPPEVDAVGRVVQRVGLASKAAARVEVPFEYIAPAPGAEWAGDASKGFDVPVGRAGATRRQMFALGRGTAQHALVAGKTGSGKSTLLHALITNLALTYSPDEAELYLIDFKEGVEFQWYATYRLPHARVVAIQSEREFGLSVLQRLDGVLRERGEKFRDTGVNDLAGYRAARPGERTPRILLVVDEFQAFFTEDDKLAQEAALLLDRLVRQGRAFGLHVLLGSQTLGGAYSLARSTIDQMAVRVALQCSDADAQLILSRDNTAARLLSRPGEAIYNDQNGLVEGNDPFQVVWLSEEKREQLLSELRDRAGDRYPPPLVFAGNTSADLAENRAVARLLDAPAVAKAPAAWLGDPVAIKDPTAAVFRAAGGSNLLVIGQNEEAARGLFAAAAVALAAQTRPDGGPALTVLDGTPDDAEGADDLPRLAARLPGGVAPSRPGLAAALAELAAEVDRRQKGAAGPPRFLFVFGLHRLRELRKADDDFGFGRRGAEREPSPAERLAAILRDGPPVGVHVLAWCDSVVNLNRAVDRPLTREFGMRVLFQMSAADSSTLMDTPAASRLGRNRALFLQEEQERPEKFRPYGVPPADWVERACDRLRAGVGLNREAAGV